MILVTGSEGFIGRNLVAALKAKGETVLEFDTKHFQPEDLFSLYEIPKIKMIYHLGAISSTLETNVGAIYRYNVEFSIDLFNMAISHQIPVVYTSSASVFGNTMKEELYIHNPLNHYALSKTQMELWIAEHYDEFKRISIPRLFNVYGLDERKSDMSTSPICKFRNQAKTEGVIKVFKGSEDMFRDFVCIDDVIVCLTSMMNGTKSGFFDVGTSNPISFLDVAQICSDKYNVPIKFIDMPEHMYGGYQYYTCARRQFGMYYTSVEKWLSLIH